MKALVVSIVVLCLIVPVYGQGVRPVREGSSCSWSVSRFEEFLASVRTDEPKASGVSRPLIAGISPHASYDEAGRVYYPLFQQLSGEDFKSYGHVVWCGHYTIPFGLLTAGQVVEAQTPRKHLVGRLFRYGDSYTDGVLAVQAAGREVTESASSLGHWYGYFSAGFYAP